MPKISVFAGGVRRAVDIAKKSLEKDPAPIQFLGGLIHNEEVIKEIKKKSFRKIAKLGVVSGTSTPDWIIKELIIKLKI